MSKILDALAKHPDQVSAIVAVLALLVSFLSIVLTVLTVRLQRRHNFMSLTPIASFPVGDYEDRLTVKLKNNGIGPLLVESLRVSDGVKEEHDLISWMPDLPEGVDWDTFYGSADGACIPAGGDLVLLQLIGEPADQDFARARDACRTALAPLTVSVQYRDIYRRRMPPASRSLAWFARHWPRVSENEVAVKVLPSKEELILTIEGQEHKRLVTVQKEMARHDE